MAPDAGWAITPVSRGAKLSMLRSIRRMRPLWMKAAAANYGLVKVETFTRIGANGCPTVEIRGTYPGTIKMVKLNLSIES